MRNRRPWSWWALRCGTAVISLLVIAYAIECFGGVRWASKDGYFVGSGEGYLGGGWSKVMQTEPGIAWKETRSLGGWIYMESGATSQVFALPLWMPLAACLPLTVWAWKRERRTKINRREGFCVRCGYDRRGIEVKKPCPECGVLAG